MLRPALQTPIAAEAHYGQSMSEAWHIMHEMDISKERHRGSQDTRTLGGDRLPQGEQPRKHSTDVATDIEMFPCPSRSREDETRQPLPTSPTHLAFVNLPSTKYLS